MTPGDAGSELDLGSAAHDRVMVIAPHPDDESLAVGGLLQRAVARGASVQVMFATDGENNPWAQRAVEWRWRIGAAERASWGARRRLEALAALARLGVGAGGVSFLGLPDQGLTDLLMAGGDEAVRVLAARMRETAPTLLLLPTDADLHPDHSALAVLARFAQERLPAEERRFQPLSFTVHRRRPEAQGACAQIRLRPYEQRNKAAAILMHTSQLRLRGRYMLGFAGEIERFALDRPPRLRRLGHPVWEAYVTGGTLLVGLARRRPVGLGAEALLIAIEEPDGAASRLVVELAPRRGRVRLRDAVRGTELDRLRLEEAGGGVYLEIPLPLGGLTSRACCYIKLERPAERRLGMFDRWGWRAVPLLDSVIAVAAGRAAQPHPAVRSLFGTVSR